MRIGILGAGQLGQMLGFAARELGHECCFLDPAVKPPALAAGSVLRADYDDIAAVTRLAKDSDVLTYEFENVPVAVLETVRKSCPVFPPLAALDAAQDRLNEKRLFERLGIPLASYRAVDSADDLHAAAAELGYPFVLKTRRFGYDGKGQAVVRDERGRVAAWEQLGGTALVAEAFVPFSHEVSIIAARDRNGQIVTWPLTRNWHKDGILSTSLAPESDQALTGQARDYVERLLTHLDYVGVLALELFVSGTGLLANEFAPRVHNSGHWTIEGSTTSQFANHVRSVTGDSVGTADCRDFAGMVNLIGAIAPGVRKLADRHIFLHDYGKSPRPGRKLGHVTVRGRTAPERDELVALVMKNVTQSTLW